MFGGNGEKEERREERGERREEREERKEERGEEAEGKKGKPSTVAKLLSSFSKSDVHSSFLSSFFSSFLFSFFGCAISFAAFPATAAVNQSSAYGVCGQDWRGRGEEEAKKRDRQT